ncbi:unnamed protein product, partial [Prorocentrum cordatum]
VTSGQMSSYDQAKRFFAEYFAGGPLDSERIRIPMAAFVSGFTAATAAAPVDLVRSRVMDDARGNTRGGAYQSALDCAWQTVKAEACRPPAGRGARRSPRAEGARWATAAPPEAAAPRKVSSAASSLAADVTDSEIEEFLEGLLEGFRAAPPQGRGVATSGASPVPPAKERPPQAGLPAGGGGRGAPARGATAPDPLLSVLRRHALRAFLEEPFGTVAAAWDAMAGLALDAASEGGPAPADGAPELPRDTLRHRFTEEELTGILIGFGYGVGAGPSWWHALFCSLDVDQDGAVSLQDMYSALVLDLPSADASEDGPAALFVDGDGSRAHAERKWIAP